MKGRWYEEKLVAGVELVTKRSKALDFEWAVVNAVVKNYNLYKLLMK